MRVEVAYADAGRQWLIAVELEPGACAGDAIQRSGILALCPVLADAPAPERLAIGICGRRAQWRTVVVADDRVEIYRPLLAEPKAARRARVQAARTLASRRANSSATRGI